MGREKFIYQKSHLETNPWSIGNSMSLGRGVITEIPDCEGDFGCPVYAMLESHQVHPIDAVPEGDEPDHVIQVSGLFTYPNNPACATPQTSATNVTFERGHDIEPVLVRTRDEAGNTLSPPYELTRLRYDYYRCSGNWPGWDWNAGQLEYPCGGGGGEGGEEPLPYLNGRWVMPILRITGWQGAILRLYVDGVLPHCIHHAVYTGVWPITAPHLRLGTWGSGGQFLFINDINNDAGGTLWGMPSEDPCQVQSVSFHLDIPVVGCDQLLVLWLATVEDDDLYGHYPASVQHTLFGTIDLFLRAELYV